MESGIKVAEVTLLEQNAVNCQSGGTLVGGVQCVGGGGQRQQRGHLWRRRPVCTNEEKEVDEEERKCLMPGDV